MRSLTLLCCCLSVEGLDELLEISLEALADFGMLEGNFAVCLHDAELVAHVVTDSVDVMSELGARGDLVAYDFDGIRYDMTCSGVGFSMILWQLIARPSRGVTSSEQYIEMSSSGTSLTPTTPLPYFSYALHS